MEYRSRASLFGIPLIHIAVGSSVNGQYRRGIATGWIAIGDIAMGILFACGGLAAGGVCIGGVAVGAFSIGGLAVGLGAMGGLGIGIVALGGAAIAWYAAMGGLAVSHGYAIGGVAHAPHVIARESNGRVPFSAIPHPPFRASDAIILVVVVAAILIFALSLRERSREG
jgi:hypothetical protein